jgi:hypothetical protein
MEPADKALQKASDLNLPTSGTNRVQAAWQSDIRFGRAVFWSAPQTDPVAKAHILSRGGTLRPKRR